MQTIQVNYEALNTKLSQLRNQINTNIKNPVESEYRQLQSSLRQIDGEACAQLQEAMEANREKAIAATSVLERLLSFMSNSSKQIQIAEDQIARVFRSARR